MSFYIILIFIKYIFYLYIFGFSKKVGTGNIPHSKSGWKDLHDLPKKYLCLKKGMGGWEWGEVDSRSTKNYPKEIKGQ